MNKIYEAYLKDDKKININEANNAKYLKSLLEDIIISLKYQMSKPLPDIRALKAISKNFQDELNEL